MRHASVPLLAALLAATSFGCASPRAEVVSQDPSAVPVATAQRGAELYGRYCTGCHAANLRASNASAPAPALMHIQARLGMGTMASWFSEALTRDDARQIVDYLDAGRTGRLAD